MTNRHKLFEMHIIRPANQLTDNELFDEPDSRQLIRSFQNLLFQPFEFRDSQIVQSDIAVGE